MLTGLVFLPLAGGLLAALVPARANPRAAGMVTLMFALATFGLSIGLLVDFESAGGLQHVTDVEWIPELGIHYKLGLDGLNLFLIVMTTLLWVATTAGSLLRGWERPGLYYLMLALGETAVLGAFCAQDLALFVLFFDLMLVPFYFLIGIWGGPNRVRATTTFVIYTLVGSLLMLAAAAATGILATPDGASTSFELTTLVDRPLSEGSQEWIFLLFAFAFLVKMPAFPLHGGCRRRTQMRRRPSSRCCRECSRRSAPTDSCGSRCRCSPTPWRSTRSCCSLSPWRASCTGR